MRDVATLLAAWRAAQRGFDSLDDTDPAIGDAAAEVARSWLAYHVATGSMEPGHVLLFADDRRRYVAVSPSAGEVLGIDAATLLQLSVDDISPPQSRAALDAQWARFISAGESSGTYNWTAGGCAPVTLGFRARANWPVRHVHVSELTAVAGAAGVGSSPSAAGSSWDAIARSNDAVEASRALVTALRGGRPAPIDRVASSRRVVATDVTSVTRTRAS